MGFFGRACIHPAQVEVANQVFTPSENEVRAARELCDRFDAAAAAGTGITVSADGSMIDLAVIRRARRTLSMATDRR